MIGTTFGNFRVVERIGDGGMGAVYRAVDEMLDREVAIKVLRPELARNVALIERFRQEAKALARLNHPRIATLHGLEKHGESLLMIMEYVRGDTFEALVQRSGRLSWTRAAELCAAVLDALDHAHDKGVVHRDIKPANVMLAAGGAVKVMDFGIARLMGKNRQTQAGHAVGTPTYMAPEQLRGEEVDGRTDLYATGAVLFELVTGRMAFEADSDYGLMMKQLNEPPAPVATYVPGVPAIIDDLISRAMAKRIDDRFRSAADFRDALQEVVASASNAQRKSTPVPAETRLASPYVAPSAASTPTPSTPTPSGSISGTPAETRLAAPSASDSGIRPTRLSEPDAYAAGGFADVRVHAPAPSASDGPSRWHDWRLFAGAGGLFAVAGVAVMLLRAPSASDVRNADSAAAAVLAADSASLSPAGGSGGDLGSGREDANSLIINRPAPPSSDGKRDGGSGSTGGGTDDEPPTPPSKPVPAPPRAKDGAGATRESAKSRDSRDNRESRDSREASPPPPVAPPAQTAAPVAADGNEAEAQARILAALDDAASALSGRNTGAASLLDGGVRDAWADLMKEGRISLRVVGAPSVQRGGGRATAEFSGAVNVRSPFGANRRSSARFSAELERRGGSWQVTRLRALDALELK